MLALLSCCAECECGSCLLQRVLLGFAPECVQHAGTVGFECDGLSAATLCQGAVRGLGQQVWEMVQHMLALYRPSRPSLSIPTEHPPTLGVGLCYTEH
mgnify:CR=1 FL=1